MSHIKVSWSDIVDFNDYLFKFTNKLVNLAKNQTPGRNEGLNIKLPEVR